MGAPSSTWRGRLASSRRLDNALTHLELAVQAIGPLADQHRELREPVLGVVERIDAIGRELQAIRSDPPLDSRPPAQGTPKVPQPSETPLGEAIDDPPEAD